MTSDVTEGDGVSSQVVKMKLMEHTLNEKRILQAVSFLFLVHLEYFFKVGTEATVTLPRWPQGVPRAPTWSLGWSLSLPRWSPWPWGGPHHLQEVPMASG